MIPREIEASELELQAVISEWKLQVMSTNWSGYWIVQLTRPDHPHLALLIDLDNLVGICNALRACIEACCNHSAFPRARDMYQHAAADLRTQSGALGAITVMSNWESEPYLVLSYFRGGRGSENVIRQALYVEDAMTLSDMFAQVYNRFPDKDNWAARTDL